MESNPDPQPSTQPSERVAVACPKCDQGYRIASRLLGRRLICRQCQHEWRAKALTPDEVRDLKARRSDSHSDQPRPSEADSSVTAPDEPPSDSGTTSLTDDMPPVAGSSSIAIDTRWAGRTLGRYKVVSILGQGGMGVVWRAHDDTLRRDVALKILSRPHKSVAKGGLNHELFMQEARAVAKLQHPAVVSIFEVAEDQGQIFLSLELMEGGTLKEFVDAHGPIEPRRLAEWMIGPAKALSLAHRRGIIHRDIKPGNLMFDDHGHLKLMDFGLAHVAFEAASDKLRGRAVGSLGWIAPETAKAQETTHLSDIYGIGLVLLYALTGKQWLTAKTRTELISLHQKPPEVDPKLLKTLPARMASIIRNCLAADPAKRFQDAEQLVRDFQECAEEDPKARSRERKHHLSIAVLGAILGALVGIGAALYFFMDIDKKLEALRQPVPRAYHVPASRPAANTAPSR